MIEAPEDPVLHAALETLLLERGALTVTELVEGLREAGAELGPAPEGDVLDVLYAAYGAPFTELDSRWVHIYPVLYGRTFTRRLTDPEIDHDLLDLSPDLVVIAGLEDAGLLQLADGAEVSVAYGFDLDGLPGLDGARAEAVLDHGSVVLPPGTLAGLQLHPGDLVSVTVGDDGLRLARVEGAVEAHPDAAGSHLVAMVATGRPLELETAVLILCADLDDAFRRPVPPFGQLVEDAGLARNGDWVAPAGFDFAAYWIEMRALSVAERHDLPRHQARTVATWVAVHREVLGLFEQAQREHPTDGGLSRDEVAALLAGADLGSRLTPEVTEAFFIDTQAWEDPLSHEALALMAELMEETASRADRPALRWLRAMAYERLGRVREAEDTLLAAERIDPGWPLTLLDLAGYASDRGDSTRGLALLARADPYADPDLTELLQVFRPVPGPTVGRNEPCWCGSGRKFKQCHLHRPTAPPLEDRAAWLYQKAGRFLRSGAWFELLSLVAAERAAYEEDDAGIETAIQDAAVCDVVLFEGGVFAEFVRLRGFLLPEDEAQLAGQWLEVQRSVYEITSVRRGVGVSVRDLRTAEVIEVRERTASTTLRTGQLICARIVPAGQTWQIFGGIEPVALHTRDALLDLLDTDPDPDELMAFLSRRHAPPTLTTGDQGPSVIADRRLATPSPGGSAFGQGSSDRS